MANNFHDVGGMLIVGIDLHEALLLPGIPPAVFVPIPMPRMPHINFLHPFTMGGNQKATVQFNGRNTVVHWHSPEKLWPHLNLPPFPIDILIPIDILFGAQIAWLPRGSVMIEGETSTCANIYGPMSINLDCWDIANIPSSMIIQPSTVQTSPSLGDYLDGLKAVAIDFAISVVPMASVIVTIAGRLRNSTSQGSKNRSTRGNLPSRMPITEPMTMAKKNARITLTRVVEMFAQSAPLAASWLTVSSTMAGVGKRRTSSAYEATSCHNRTNDSSDAISQPSRSAEAPHPLVTLACLRVKKVGVETGAIAYEFRITEFNQKFGHFIGRSRLGWRPGACDAGAEIGLD